MLNSIEKVAMDSILESIRVALIAAIIATFKDAQTLIALIILIGFINFAVGLWAGKKQKESYSHKKAFRAVTEFLTAICVIFVTAASCRLLDPEKDFTYIIQILTVLVFVMYAKNVTRNLKIIQPENEFILLLDIIINSKYIKIKKKIKDGTLFDQRTDTLSDGETEGDKQSTEPADNKQFDPAS